MTRNDQRFAARVVICVWAVLLLPMQVSAQSPANSEERNVSAGRDLSFGTMQLQRLRVDSRHEIGSTFLEFQLLPSHWESKDSGQLRFPIEIERAMMMDANALRRPQTTPIQLNKVESPLLFPEAIERAMLLDGIRDQIVPKR